MVIKSFYRNFQTFLFHTLCKYQKINKPNSTQFQEKNSSCEITGRKSTSGLSQVPTAFETIPDSLFSMH